MAFFYDNVKLSLPNTQVGPVEHILPGCCTPNRSLEMIMGKVKNGPGQKGGNGLGKSRGEVSVRGGWPGLSHDLQGPRCMGSPLS